jgi:uncharacterized RDD family membrane protein YckC
MASAEYSVLTPERVNLQYDIAGIGSRGAAAMVDTAIQGVALVVVLLAGSAAVGLGASLAPVALGRSGGVALVALFVLALFAITNGYYMLFEILWSGQTPGKRLVGVRVLRENGYSIRPIDAVIRNVVRIVDWLPLLYGVGVLTMLLNNRSRRLGDFASGTIVVREASRGRVSSVPVSMARVSESVSRGVALSSVDATLVRDFLVRRGSMNAASRADVAQRLAEALATRYALRVDGDPEGFLEQLDT